jgi:hypothetical protein
VPGGRVEEVRDVFGALCWTGIKFSERPVGPLCLWRC